MIYINHSAWYYALEQAIGFGMIAMVLLVIKELVHYVKKKARHDNN
jgi:hypothetical protein